MKTSSPVWLMCLCLTLISSLCVTSSTLAQLTNRPEPSLIAFSSVKNHTDQIRYAYTGNQEKLGIIFVHGTPGGWDAFANYLLNPQLQRDFFMVSVDRVGWGGSSALASKTEKADGDFIRQANGITAVMNAYPNKQWIVLGHSLGASIAPQVALSAPNAVKGLLLLAGSLEPKLGKPRWYNRVASTWLVSWMLGKELNNSNREIMRLRQQLSDTDKRIKNSQLKTHVVVMQGMRDRLVSPKNPDYVASAWSPHFGSVELIKLPEAGHFLPWRERPRIIASLYQLVAKFDRQ